jgi:ankyrin repeat protein
VSLHELLDTGYGPDGDAELRRRLAAGAVLEERDASGEAPLHVATRRRRESAVRILLEAGAEVDARNAHGKTAFAHAARRGFDDVVAVVCAFGADQALAAPDRLAVAVVSGRLDQARALLEEHPEAARTGNPEEDRLLADVAGRAATEPVELLIAAGADLAAPGLDGGTPLHQACWFGQPDNARPLIEAGAPLDVFDPTHHASPIHWVAHGSSCSDGAAEHAERYEDLARILLGAGCALEYPGATDGAYLRRILTDAAPKVAALVRLHLGI